MKLIPILEYHIFKLFPKKIIKLFDRLYNHRLNYNLLNLLHKGLKIEIIYDIGAYRGKWSSFLNNTSLKNKKFFLFEANEKNGEYLDKFDFKYFLEVLSDKSKDVEFYSQLSTGDSYLLEQTSFYKNNIKPTIKRAISLDELVKKENLPYPNFIKIDTQGSELDILKGSQQSISECSLIYLECPIIEYNLKAPNINEYIKYLDSIGFVPYDICEIPKMDNILIQIDILFIKKSILIKIHPEKKNLNILNSN
jgi:FkbM family methyltransferase|tara:strand:- start:139 stop:891 length:753 start_codon:yes stop_codon:yes gene_type:complete